jgi:glycosyltransferase involved in cell wall biosynthesis
VIEQISLPAGFPNQPSAAGRKCPAMPTAVNQRSRRSRAEKCEVENELTGVPPYLPKGPSVVPQRKPALQVVPAKPAPRPQLLCLSHLRWDFVTQRPQHLMTRAARQFEVTFFEEPVEDPDAPSAGFLRSVTDGPVRVVTPFLRPEDMQSDSRNSLLRGLVTQAMPEGQEPDVAWYYSPMMLAFSEHLRASVTVYDCMDELSAFLGAPAEQREMEAALMDRADLVFTGGFSLFDARKDKHPSVHCFPSSIDRAHFGRARLAQPDPEPQAHIKHPRVGFFGVIDERMDLDLVARTARDAPDLQFIMLGPVVKIDPASLPRLPNIHWLGKQSYEDLPRFLAHWDVGWMPFALNEATRFISPTKTPEFLAAGVPLVSTAVRDVVRGWGIDGLVRIACADTMVLSLRAEQRGLRPARRAQIEAALASGSWDRTWAAMAELINRELAPQPTQPVIPHVTSGARPSGQSRPVQEAS